MCNSRINPHNRNIRPGKPCLHDFHYPEDLFALGSGLHVFFVLLRPRAVLPHHIGCLLPWRLILILPSPFRSSGVVASGGGEIRLIRARPEKSSGPQNDSCISTQNTHWLPFEENDLRGLFRGCKWAAITLIPE